MLRYRQEKSNVRVESETYYNHQVHWYVCITIVEGKICQRLNTSTPEEAKTNHHLIIEEYNGETLTHNEAAKITELVKSSDLKESNIFLLAQPLMKNRSWNIGKESYERETCMFRELENAFKIVKLEEVLRCSNKIFGVTKSVQNFVRNKDSVFETEMDGVTFKQQQQHDEDSLLSSNQPAVGTSGNGQSSYPSEDSSKTDRSLDLGMDLDKAFQRSSPVKKRNAPKSKIVSKFGFFVSLDKEMKLKG